MWKHLKQDGIILPKVGWKEINKEIDPVLLDMEKVGIQLDSKHLQNLSKKIEIKLEKLEKRVHTLSKENFNLNSPSQLAEILFQKLKLPTNGLKKTKSGFSTAASELKKIEKNHKIVAPLLEYRELSKLVSTYLKPLPLMADENGRLHTTYSQETSTGRINSNEPNLQNIPIKGEYGTEIRKAFVANPGMVLIAADYSQIELRIAACLADDVAMIEAFTSGVDIHSKTAAEIFDIPIKKVTANERRVAKTVNFGILYGMSPYGLSQALSIDQNDAAKYITKYFSIHTGIKDYANRMIKIAREEGHVETLFGFRRSLPNIDSHIRSLAESEERMAINAPVQGTAAEVLKLAMVDLFKKLEKERDKDEVYPRMLLTIHDEIVVEVPENQAKKIVGIIKDSMEKVITLCVPMEVKVEVGQNFGEMDEIKV
jgi:DNA polymerase-1